jgi:flavin reductase (DIM6/NTAB) family NADH-FMN oxidoreductase RutF
VTQAAEETPMIVDLQELAPGQVYFHMIQALVPRPIAWVLSENQSGRFNLAPFSYFNAVCSDPPLIMLSVGQRAQGGHKDTRVNIEQRRDFVVHIAHREMLQALNASSAERPPEVSEVDELELETEDFPGSRLPRLADCRIAMGCECYRIDEIGRAPQSLILGLVKRLYVSELVAEHDQRGRLQIDARRLDPLGRLGADQYMHFGELVRLKRPR